MNRRWWVGGAIAVVAVAAVAAAVAVGGRDKLAGAQAGKGKDDKPKPALEFTPAEVVAPQRVTMPGMVEFSGPLVAPGTAVVRAKAGGTLLALSVNEGSRVRAGQSLGSIDLADLNSRIAERQALIESARATLAQAERNLAQNERLAAQGFISSAALDSARASVDTARAQLRAAEAQLSTTKVALRDTSLVAPIGGIVARRHAVPGEKLQAEQPVLTIVDLGTLELAGSVGTHEVSRLAPGMAATIEVEGVGDPVTGRIARIAPAAEPGTRSIGVTIGLDNPQERLRAGQYAVARVTLADDTERLTLPSTAVTASAGQHHVWVIDSGTLQRRAVTLGRRDERQGRVEVLDGVTPASAVLAARFDNLREGAKAVVVAARSAPVASASAPAAR
jgi:RND family efflux transporter MFP subunit